jgi:ribosomal protein S6E (S10)
MPEGMEQVGAEKGNGASNPPAGGSDNSGKLSPEIEALIGKAVSSERKKLRDDFEDRLKPLTEKAALADTLQGEISGLKQMIEELKGGEDPEDEPADFIEELERELDPPKWATTKEAKETWRAMRRAEIRRTIREKTHEETLSGLQSTIKKLEESYTREAQEKETERTAKLALERESKIQSIAMSLRDDVVDPEIVGEWIDRRVIRASSGKLMFKIPGGDDEDVVPLTKDVVQKHLKPTLLRSAAGSGGSGAGGGRKTPEEAVSGYEQELAAVNERLSKTPNDQHLIGEVFRLKRAIAKAKAAA